MRRVAVAASILWVSRRLLRPVPAVEFHSMGDWCGGTPTMPRPFPKDDKIASARYPRPPIFMPELAAKRREMITRSRIAGGARARARALFPRRDTPAAGDRSIENYFSDYAGDVRRREIPGISKKRDNEKEWADPKEETTNYCSEKFARHFTVTRLWLVVCYWLWPFNFWRVFQYYFLKVC